MEAFQILFRSLHIQGHPMSTKNPQANSICEWMHQAVGNSLRAMATMNPPAGLDSANHMVDTTLANCLLST